MEWQQYGMPHRTDGGPAIIRKAPEVYEWYRDNLRYRDDDKPVVMERRRDGGWRVTFTNRGLHTKRDYTPDEPLPADWLDFAPYGAPAEPRPNTATE